MSRTPSRVQDSDVTWIIALWRALHSTDAEIEDVAAEVTAIFSQYLPCGPAAQPANDQALQSIPMLSREVVAYEDSAKEGSWEVGAAEDYIPNAFDLAVIEEKAREYAIESFHLNRQGTPVCPDALSIHHYYFKFKGRTYCFELPALPCSPAAA